MKQFLVTYILMLVLALGATAQDLHFSQYYEQTPLRNPAIAGLFQGDIKLSANYRDQWRSVTKFPFKTGAGSIEIKFPLGKNNNTFLTTGLQTIFDKAGEVGLRRTHVLPFANLYVAVGDAQFISAGIIGGWAGSQFDATKIRLGDQWVNGFYNPGNPTQTFSRSTYSYMDVGAGASYVYGTEDSDNQLYFGAALFHINQPNVAFNSATSSSKLPMKIAVNAGYALMVGEDAKLTFHSDFYRQARTNQIIVTGLYTVTRVVDAQSNLRNQFGFGAMYRHKDAIIPVVQLKHWQGLAIGLSYDANVSQLRTGSSTIGGMEINISKTFRLAKREGIPCPAFDY